MIRIHPLDPDVRLDLEPDGPPLSPEDAAAVDRLWEAEMAARGAGLFDGPIFSLKAHTPARLSVRRLTYRRLIAARRDPALAGRLGLRPVGVTALLLSPEGLVLGRRNRRLHTEPGRWEAAPAGVLDRLDWRAVVLDELREELGLDADQIDAPVAVALVEEVRTGVCDILCRMRTPLSAAEIRAAWRSGGTDEHEELAVVPLDALDRFLAGQAGAVLEALPAMLVAGLPR